MKDNWITETTKLMSVVNEKTEKLMKLNLNDEEFHKKHQEIMDFWEAETKKLQNKYPMSNRPKAKPKSSHQINHMTNKYYIHKILNQIY